MNDNENNIELRHHYIGKNIIKFLRKSVRYRYLPKSFMLGNLLFYNTKL